MRSGSDFCISSSICCRDSAIACIFLSNSSFGILDRMRISILTSALSFTYSGSSCIRKKFRKSSFPLRMNVALSPVFIIHDELGQVRGPRSELYSNVPPSATTVNSMENGYAFG